MVSTDQSLPKREANWNLSESLLWKQMCTDPPATKIPVAFTWVVGKRAIRLTTISLVAVPSGVMWV